MAQVITKGTIYPMSHEIWAYHFSIHLNVPQYVGAILVKRLENEQMLSLVKKFEFKNIYLAVNKDYIDPPITTVEQYDYKLRKDSVIRDDS